MAHIQRLTPVWIAVPREVPRASRISQKTFQAHLLVTLHIQSELWERSCPNIQGMSSPRLSPVAEQTAFSSGHSATEFPKEKHHAAIAELGGMFRAFFSSEVPLVLNFRSLVLPPFGSPRAGRGPNLSDDFHHQYEQIGSPRAFERHHKLCLCAFAVW